MRQIGHASLGAVAATVLTATVALAVPALADHGEELGEVVAEQRHSPRGSLRGR